MDSQVLASPAQMFLEDTEGFGRVSSTFLITLPTCTWRSKRTQDVK